MAFNTDKLVKAMLLGTAAGILDVTPMVFQALSWQASVSAFLHWLGLGVIITYARLPLRGWLSGLTIALLTGLPIAVIVSERDPGSVLPVLVSSAVLGASIGYLAEKTINNKPPHQG